MILFFYMIALHSYAQSTDTTSAYIVDGKFVQSVSDIKPTDIFGVSILKDSAAVALYGPQAANGAVVITTKPLAIKEYQKKLSAFSKKYQSYIAEKGDDSKLLYVINNTMLQVGTNHSIRELYQLDPEDIVSVTFKTDRHFTNDATVIILTKDNQ